MRRKLSGPSESNQSNISCEPKESHAPSEADWSSNINLQIPMVPAQYFPVWDGASGARWQEEPRKVLMLFNGNLNQHCSITSFIVSWKGCVEPCDALQSLALKKIPFGRCPLQMKREGGVNLEFGWSWAYNVHSPKSDGPSSLLTLLS